MRSAFKTGIYSGAALMLRQAQHEEIDMGEIMTFKNTITTLALLLLGTAPLMAQDVPTNPHQTEAPELAFTSIEIGQLPANREMGEASSVATDSKGHVFVFSRGNSTGPAYGSSGSQLLGFDA